VLEGYTWFHLDRLSLDDAETGYAQIYRLLAGQAGVQAEAVGAVKPLPPLAEIAAKTDFMYLIEDIHRGVTQIEAGVGRLEEQGQTLQTGLQDLSADIRAQLEEIIAVTRSSAGQREQLSPQQRYDQALQEVAFKHDLQPEELRAAIDAWAHKVKTDPQASPYDLALTEYKANHFEPRRARIARHPPVETTIISR
jgi:hypothetical protein